MTFLSGRISHYPNSKASFNLTRIAVSGDVSVNPVPAATGNASVKCPICWKTVANPYRAVSCDTCLCWVHIKCGKITQRKYKKLQNLSAFVWSFPGCVHNQTFPFASRNNVNLGFYADLAEQDGNAERRVHIYKSLRDSLGNTNLRVRHINVNGLMNKLSEVNFRLSEVKFDVLTIIETLSDSVSDDLIRKLGFDSVRKDRSGSKRGGVLIYYQENLTVHHDLKWDVQELEAVWINITMRSQSTLIGCLYRPPKDMAFFFILSRDF